MDEFFEYFLGGVAAALGWKVAERILDRDDSADSATAAEVRKLRKQVKKWRARVREAEDA